MDDEFRLTFTNKRNFEDLSHYIYFPHTFSLPPSFLLLLPLSPSLFLSLPVSLFLIFSSQRSFLQRSTEIAKAPLFLFFNVCVCVGGLLEMSNNKTLSYYSPFCPRLFFVRYKVRGIKCFWCHFEERRAFPPATLFPLSLFFNPVIIRCSLSPRT